MGHTVRIHALTAAVLITATLHGSMLWTMNASATAAPSKAAPSAAARLAPAAAAPAVLPRFETLQPVLIKGSHSAYLAEQATARARPGTPTSQAVCVGADTQLAQWSMAADQAVRAC